MKRGLAVCALVAAAASVAPPAPAASRHVVRGRVVTASAHPAVARTAYLVTPSTNGVAGFVAPIQPGPRRPFELRRTGGATGIEELDVYFYRDIRGAGSVCDDDTRAAEGGGETGTVCDGAAWAVVVLRSGADARFTLSYDM